MERIQNNSVDYYSKIPDGRDINILPKESSADTSIGYQYTGMPEEMRIAWKALDEHYDKVYQENLKHSDPMLYINAKYSDFSSPYFCSYMTEDQRDYAYRAEKRMLETGGKNRAGLYFGDYSLRNLKGIYTGDTNTGFARNMDNEKTYARSVVNQQIQRLFVNNGIRITSEMDLKFSINPYTYSLTVTGNAEKETLSLIEKLLNEGDNGKNIWSHAWNSMHDKNNVLVNSQGSSKKASQYSLWHEFHQVTGYDIRSASYKNGTFIAEDGTDLLKLFKEKSTRSEAVECYSERFYKLAKDGWNTSNDLTITIGFDSSGLYDIGQKNGYGANQTSWIRNPSQTIFDAKA